MPLSESHENYLKAILILRREKGSIHAVDLAAYMKFSKASISRALGKLCSEGYACIGADGTLELTALGEAEAERIYERHRFFEQELTALGVPRERAHADACRLEHAVSAESFEALRQRTEKR